MTGKPMPEPWEYDIQFDETNGHITQLVAGDNEKFQGYIEAHNRSVDGVRESIETRPRRRVGAPATWRTPTAAARSEAE